jgi:hypothetical protein
MLPEPGKGVGGGGGLWSIEPVWVLEGTVPAARTVLS